MESFFSKDQVTSNKISKVPQSCASCGLSKKALRGRMAPWGKFGKRILLIGGAPNRHEDRRGKPWTDAKGDLIKWAFKQNGIDIYKDCITSFACLCPPLKNKKLEDREINCCRKKIISLIKEKKPSLIFLIDDIAINSIIGSIWKKGLGGITKWRGWTIPDRETGAWLCPIFSPGYIEFKEDRKGRNLAKRIWLDDIKVGLAKLDQKFHFENEKKYLTHVTDTRHLKDVCERIIKADLLSFDYEGTGLKPHQKGHQITTVSACIDPKECYVWDHTQERTEIWRKVLESKVGKSAHNLSFENEWSKIIMKAIVNNWQWDSMINAHLIDNRTGVTGLKFQTYVNFGMGDYDSHISPWLSSDDEQGANSFNRILEYIKRYGSKSVREYCGLDSIFGFMLTKLQMEIINTGNHWGFGLTERKKKR